MNLKVTKNIQQLVAQRRAKKIETVRNEVITVNLKEARAKLVESTTTPTPAEPQDVAPVTETIIEKSEATPQAPAHDTASLSPMGDDSPAPAPVDVDVSSWKWVNPACSDCDPVDVDVSSGTDSESVAAPIPPTVVAAPDVAVKKPTRSRSRSKSKSKK